MNVPKKLIHPPRHLGQAIDNLVAAAHRRGQLEGALADQEQIRAAVEEMTAAHDMVFSMLDRVTDPLLRFGRPSQNSKTGR